MEIKTMFAVIVVMTLLSTSSFAKTARVRGHVRRKSGTYVYPHHKTSPNKTKVDNWSAKGNANPYTGKEGTVDPDRKTFAGTR